MSGVLGIIAAPSVGRVTITLEEIGPNTYGAPSVAVAMQDVTIFFASYSTVAQEFKVQLAPGDLTQSAFKRIDVEDATAGSFQSFTAADATFSDIGATVQWTWAAATLWSAADVAEEKRVILYF